jgi:hypothetical protein
MLFESLLSTFELVVAIKHGLYVNSKILCVVLCGDQKRAPLFAPPFNFSQKFSCYGWLWLHYFLLLKTVGGSDDVCGPPKYCWYKPTLQVLGCY